MKRKMLCMAVIAFFCGFNAMFAQALITFDKLTHNFGTFDESKLQTCVFSFKNTGDKPLVITQAFASCGCTAPSFTKEPIMPGKKGEITVTYNGAGKFPGEFKKAVTINSNAKNNMVRLFIEGVMNASKK